MVKIDTPPLGKNPPKAELTHFPPLGRNSYMRKWVDCGLLGCGVVDVPQLSKRGRGMADTSADNTKLPGEPSPSRPLAILEYEYEFWFNPALQEKSVRTSTHKLEFEDADVIILEPEWRQRGDSPPNVLPFPSLLVRPSCLIDKRLIDFTNSRLEEEPSRIISGATSTIFRLLTSARQATGRPATLAELTAQHERPNYRLKCTVMAEFYKDNNTSPTQMFVDQKQEEAMRKVYFASDTKIGPKVRKVFFARGTEVSRSRERYCLVGLVQMEELTWTLADWLKDLRLRITHERRSLPGETDGLLMTGHKLANLLTKMMDNEFYHFNLTADHIMMRMGSRENNYEAELRVVGLSLSYHRASAPSQPWPNQQLRFGALGIGPVSPEAPYAKWYDFLTLYSDVKRLAAELGGGPFLDRATDALLGPSLELFRKENPTFPIKGLLNPRIALSKLVQSYDYIKD